MVIDSVRSVSSTGRPTTPGSTSSSSRRSASPVGSNNVDVKPQIDTVAERMLAQRIRDGDDPDNAEFEHLRMPTPAIVEYEMSETYNRRIISVSSLSMAELSDPRLMDVMTHSREFRMHYVHNDVPNPDGSGTTVSEWRGCVLIILHSAADADEAMTYIKEIRPSLVVRNLGLSENMSSALHEWRHDQRSFLEILGKSMADILIVSNVADDVTVDALHEIFPDARDITLPLMRIRFKGKEVGSLKGYAYLTFGTREKLEEVYEMYSSRPRMNFKDNRLRIMKYEPPRDIPVGYLRLRRRFRILNMINTLQTTGIDTETMQEKERTRLNDSIFYWSSIVAEDNKARQRVSIPAYTLDELHHLLCVPRSDDMKKLAICSLLKQSDAERVELEGLRAKFSGDSAQFESMARSHQKEKERYRLPGNRFDFQRSTHDAQRPTRGGDQSAKDDWLAHDVHSHDGSHSDVSENFERHLHPASSASQQVVHVDHASISSEHSTTALPSAPISVQANTGKRLLSFGDSTCSSGPPLKIKHCTDMKKKGGGGSFEHSTPASRTPMMDAGQTNAADVNLPASAVGSSRSEMAGSVDRHNATGGDGGERRTATPEMIKRSPNEDLRRDRPAYRGGGINKGGQEYFRGVSFNFRGRCDGYRRGFRGHHAGNYPSSTRGNPNRFGSHSTMIRKRKDFDANVRNRR